MTQPHVEKKWSKKASIELVVFLALTVVAVVLLAPQGVWADDPTSRYVSLTPIPTRNLPASSTNGIAVQFQIWDAATGGNLISTEPHTVDTDSASNITHDQGFTDLLLGRGQPGGLNPNNYLPGQSRYLDVIYVATGTSALTSRIPLYASPFSVSPGSQGPAGPQGPAGTQGPQGPAGPASSVTGVIAGTDLIGGGTTGNVTLSLNVGATDARYAQLGASNTFATSQNVNGNFFSSGTISAGNSLSIMQSCGLAARCVGYISAFLADSLGNTSNSGNTATGGNTTTFGNTQTFGILRSENGGLSLGGFAPLSVDAPGIPGGRFTVLSNGYVGIGNPNPAVNLDVAGPIRAAALSTGSIRIGGDVQMSSAPHMSFSGYRSGTLCNDNSCSPVTKTFCNLVSSVIGCIAGFFVPDKDVQITRINVSLGVAIDQTCDRGLFISQPGNPPTLVYHEVLPGNSNYGDSGPIAVNLTAGQQYALSTVVGPCNFGTSGGGDLFINVQYVMR